MDKVFKVQPEILDFPQLSSSSARRAKLDPARYEVLLSQLPSATDALSRCRACEIPENALNSYVALGWLCWNRGRLDVTELGQSLTQQMIAIQANVVETKARVEALPIHDPASSDLTLIKAVPTPRAKAQPSLADLIKAREKHRLTLAKKASRTRALEP